MSKIKIIFLIGVFFVFLFPMSKAQAGIFSSLGDILGFAQAAKPAQKSFDIINAAKRGELDEDAKAWLKENGYYDDTGSSFCDGLDTATCNGYLAYAYLNGSRNSPLHKAVNKMLESGISLANPGSGVGTLGLDSNPSVPTPTIVKVKNIIDETKGAAKLSREVTKSIISDSGKTTTQKQDSCSTTGEEMPNDSQLNFPSGTSELKVTLNPNKWSPWIKLPDGKISVSIVSSREDKEYKEKFSDGTIYVNTPNSHDSLGIKPTKFQLISHCSMIITISITSSSQSVSLSKEVATKILSKFLKDTHYRTEKVMGLGLGYRKDYDAYCFAIFNTAGSGTYLHSLEDNGYIAITPTDYSNNCFKFTDKSKPYLVYGSDGLVKEVIKVQLKNFNIESFAQNSVGRYEAEYTYTNTLTPFAWLSIIGEPKESGSGAATITSAGICWNVNSGLDSKSICPND